MALPPQNATPRLEIMQREVERLAGQLFEFPELQPGDYQLFGAYIQMYNFIDMNLRRCVEAFHLGNVLSVDVRWQRLREAELVGVIIGAVRTMDPDIEPVDETIGRLTEIEFRRSFRNMMGHFAARRYPNEEAIVFFSNDHRDSMRIHNRPLGPTMLLNSLVEVPVLRDLMAHVAQYERWIALKTHEWYRRYTPHL
ncbi:MULTISPECIES: hypothetical protein [unclassified Bradyrhizobium]|uniref:hypothetical protein n=1 Tax=unclassified Bradyrhizobium TaxID=2631580 RepID=UPI003394CDC7